MLRSTRSSLTAFHLLLRKLNEVSGATLLIAIIILFQTSTTPSCCSYRQQLALGALYFCNSRTYPASLI